MLYHGGSEYAGYLSFLLLLSIFPFLFFFTAVAGHIGSIVDESSYEITRKLLSLFIDGVPENIIEGIMPYIKEILEGPTQSLLTFTILGAIWTASSIVEGLKAAVNRAYNFSTDALVYEYIFRRCISIVQFLMISMTILLFLLFPTIYPLLTKNLKFLSLVVKPDWIPYNILTTFCMFFFVAALYIFFPKERQKFIDVIPGSVAVVALWIITSVSFSFYLRSFTQMSLIYGSIAGIIVIMTYFYLINLCFIYGAELNALNKRLGDDNFSGW
ncbi:yihY family inner membrane domain protein [Neorickettsia helminthoeca str. Oregon]|uniref:YihY family inner membrane domain protein n=1 Tax=Neorickettsia helminthoeca str. Oregon TaxID=1286528 RepID=X5H429_9RICK|nr:YihY/virulence factor BrkB family protein [Neorickettsia helminthoeca]AHX11326.1 yihY family inner membrane domain protein [Neorickettsia helminthoeca str. Oregon]